MPRQQKSAINELDSYARTEIDLNSFSRTEIELNSYARTEIELNSYVNIQELAAQIGRIQATPDGRIIITATGRKIRVFD